MSLPNPVEQESYDVIINKLSRVMKEVAEESMKRAAVEENSSSPDNLLTVSGEGTLEDERTFIVDWSIYCNRGRNRKNYSGSAGKKEVDGMLRIFNRSEKLHNLKYSNYIGDGDTKTFNALSENKPYGDDHLIQKIECVGHVQKRMGTRLRKLKLVYSKKKLSDGKTISGKDLAHPALLKKCLGGKTQNPNESLNSLIWKFCPKTISSSLHIAEIAANLATSVFNDGNQILITILVKFGLKINRNVCVSLAERDNRRIFTSRQRRLESSFEARRAKKIKRVKKLSCFRNRKVYLMILEHFSMMTGGWRGWFVAGVPPPRLQVRPRPKSVDFRDAENQQRPCRMIIWHVEDP
ncbi:uncharacterized protein TNCV_28241 [Trichonephila clavipes]|uniref:Mutator-like transposase domain-containing protein n=1 Tax=Trichonephila clavipes TaxID=2585209 RepID=A0A8X6WKJ1_TRICX|nr:uncharacterized protein TNCV_28241 [Trichonephila clavipes]